MVSEKNKIEINCSTISKVNENTILIIYKMGYKVELKDVKEVDDIYVKLAEGKKVFSILDSTDQNINFSQEAQKYLATKGKAGQLLRASIVVINTMPARIITRIFMSFHKPGFPMKIVKTRNEAYDWINKSQQKN